MGVSTKIIKRRIKSVSSTRKITKAMEMVAAAKMRRAVEAALSTRTYATMAWDLLVNLSHLEKKKFPLLEIRPVKKLLMIIITSNRGLCGSLNSNIIKKTAAQLKDPKNISKHRVLNAELSPNDNIEVDIIGIGKKGAEFAKKTGYNLIASFSDIPDTPRLEDASPVSKMIIESYEKRNYDKIVVAYTDYRSAIFQTAKLRQVLPISEQDLEKMISSAGSEFGPAKLPANLELEESLFEPNADSVLRIILPRLVEVQIYQALLESSASEHSARMMAMRNASDAASDMIKELTLSYNKARQAGITQEIAEIASGAAALN